MKLNEFKNILSSLNHPAFALPSGEHVPPHYHLTEVGEITKNFVDCGGTVRHEKVVNFQLWTADDFDHRLEAQTVISIIEMELRSIEEAEMMLNLNCVAPAMLCMAIAPVFSSA